LFTGTPVICRSPAPEPSRFAYEITPSELLQYNRSAAWALETHAALPSTTAAVAVNERR
jgi:hypothetical protein